MPSSSPSSTTLRLLACVEAFAHEEEGAIGHDDWPALAELFDRELALLTRLAELNPGATLPELQARAAALQERYAGLGRRLDAAHRRASEELAVLKQTGRRTRDIRATYGHAA